MHRNSERNAPQSSFLDKDYNEIDRDLLGSSMHRSRQYIAPNDAVAPAQDGVFLSGLKTTSEMLRRFDPRYRE